MEKKLQDKDLGVITLRMNKRARRYSIRVKNGVVIATIPLLGNESTMLELIDTNRSKLIDALQKYPREKKLFDDKTELQTNTFKLHIFLSDRENYYMTLHEGVLHIACPMNTDFTHERVQQIINGFLEKALRHEAKRILPKRLHQLANHYHFSYSGVKINNSKTRWGSCSSKGSINLSLSLMLLPDHLIDYVLLHELCHTQEMNHSEHFWQLMDQVTQNKATELRKELKGYRLL